MDATDIKIELDKQPESKAVLERYLKASIKRNVTPTVEGFITYIDQEEPAHGHLKRYVEILQTRPGSASVAGARQGTEEWKKFS